MVQTQRRARLLTPYLMPSPKRGIIGHSKYAERLRKQVVAAARDRSRRPVLVFGEPGLEKSNIAALVHFNSPIARNGPIACLDCARLDTAGISSEIFGRGDKEGLVEAIGDGTLVLQNVHKLSPGVLQRLVRLLADGTYRRLACAPAGAHITPIVSIVSLASMDCLHGVRAHGDEEDGADGDGKGNGNGNGQPMRRATCRVVMTASRQVAQVDENLVTVIKVPPLRLRPADVKDLQKYFLSQLARRRAHAAAGSGGGTAAGGARATPRLELTPAALRQLESYTWPGNIKEVKVAVERALQQVETDAAQAVKSEKAAVRTAKLSEDVFWMLKQKKDIFRVNLLTASPALRSFLRSDLWPNAINFNFTAYVYPAIVAMLMFGPQDRLHNPALAVFWDYWWPLVFLSFPLLGRVWCAVCPFMIWGELVQKWRTSPAGGAAKLLKWPKEQAEAYGPPFLFSLFAAILMWEEVWDLPHTADLSGWLLLLITAGAVACSSIFERRFWCRYLCPIGGMNGLFAKLSVTEVRARQGVCAGECTTYHCIKGGPAQLPEGLATDGCPLGSHPAQLVDNHDCVNCMSCVKACPNGSVEVRLRPPGTDLWSGHTASAAEVSLMFMLLGAVYLHDLPQLLGQVGLDASALGLTSVTPQHILTSFAVLFAPGLAAWGADVAGRAAAARGLNIVDFVQRRLPWNNAARAGAPATVPAAPHPLASMSGVLGSADLMQAAEPPPFVELAYGYLPLVWFATVSYYLPSLMGEAGQILPITAAFLGADGSGLPAVSVEGDIITFLQGFLLLFGGFTATVLSRKLAAAPFKSFAPQLLGIAAFTAELWALQVAPHHWLQ
ncbi:hypothetical protein HXX76_000596 [Chlamydomonas incerta]|uniref:Uncharacterized protein n=1 Tax=Chlamydomonas incerta TaxID=51695 RepID=A0A835WEM4_CHLIN|nr:hypothetical protein HXX76_000596 [Chlamydomonas incerta]|eukprot:KAG2445993.1 hypothetical protein HXX76_000596 [Chlamydomonas incerta]